MNKINQIKDETELAMYRGYFEAIKDLDSALLEYKQDAASLSSTGIELVDDCIDFIKRFMQTKSTTHGSRPGV